MDPMEIHTGYQFQHLLSISHTITPDSQNSILTVAIHYTFHPTFKKVQDIDGYKLTVIGLYPDLQKKTASTIAVESALIRLDEVVAPLHMTLAVPKAARNYVACIKIEGWVNGKLSDTRGTNGLCLIGAGRC